VFTKPLPRNSSGIFAYLAVVAYYGSTRYNTYVSDGSRGSVTVLEQFVTSFMSAGSEVLVVKNMQHFLSFFCAHIKEQYGHHLRFMVF
jgi:hypothetical protein